MGAEPAPRGDAGKRHNERAGDMDADDPYRPGCSSLQPKTPSKESAERSTQRDGKRSPYDVAFRCVKWGNIANN